MVFISFGGYGEERGGGVVGDHPDCPQMMEFPLLGDWQLPHTFTLALHYEEHTIVKLIHKITAER